MILVQVRVHVDRRSIRGPCWPMVMLGCQELLLAKMRFLGQLFLRNLLSTRMMQQAGLRVVVFATRIKVRKLINEE